MQGRIATRKTNQITTVKSRKVKIEVDGMTIIVGPSKTKSNRMTVRIISELSTEATVTGIDFPAT